MRSIRRECKCKTAKVHGDRHIKGAKVPGNESSIELSFPGAKRSGSERAKERIIQGAKVPGSELARVLLADSLRGANWPGSEEAWYPVLQSSQAGSLAPGHHVQGCHLLECQLRVIVIPFHSHSLPLPLPLFYSFVPSFSRRRGAVPPSEGSYRPKISHRWVL